MLHFWVEKICSALWAWYYTKPKIRVQKKKRDGVNKVKRIYLKRRRQPVRCR